MITKNFLRAASLAAITFLAISCSKDHDDNPDANADPAAYALGVGITANGTTTNYVVKAPNLREGTISLENNGLTLAGYRDYTSAGNTIFALGGFEEANVNAVTQDASGKLEVSGNAVLQRPVDGLIPVDDNQMLGIEYPTIKEGDQAMFYVIDINTQNINKKFALPLTPLIEGGDHPVYSGAVLRDDKLFVSNLHFDASSSTKHTDKNYVAIYSYPEIKLEKLITDTRTGPTGAWETKNGLFLDEQGDIYSMSSSNISNGYSQSTKPGGFLRIKKGEEKFDSSYFFETDKLGGKISHIKYIGDGLVFAAISTLTNQTADDRWGDKALKLSIIDVYNQTITDIKEEGESDINSLIHNGVGGRSFPVLVENGTVYYPITKEDGSTFIYAIDVANKTAKQGAEIQATFVGGVFKMN